MQAFKKQRRKQLTLRESLIASSFGGMTMNHDVVECRVVKGGFLQYY